MARRAVLFDWRGTLCTSPGPEWAIETCLRRLGRPGTPGDVAALLRDLLSANSPTNRLDTPGMDTDAALHRNISMAVFCDAGFDTPLAQALYDIDETPAYNQFALDALPTVQALAQRDIAVGVISDIHFDIRPLFDAAGFAGLVSSFTLSFEQGVQKPDPRIFDCAVASLGVVPAQVLMVGDRSCPDGGAVEHGITTLLLPSLSDANDARLHQVLALCDA